MNIFCFKSFTPIVILSGLFFLIGLPTVSSQTLVNSEAVKVYADKMMHLSDSLMKAGEVKLAAAVQYDSIINLLTGQEVEAMKIDRVYKGRSYAHSDTLNFVIHYTSYYCGPCRCKIPSINKIAAEQKDSIFQIIVIEDPLKYVAQIVDKYSNDNCVVLSDDNAYFRDKQSFRVKDLLPLPASVFIDSNNRIVAIQLGANCEEDKEALGVDKNYLKIKEALAKFTRH